jgi:hypothetical protein
MCADWSWRRAPSGIEYEALLWAERDGVALSEGVHGEAPYGVAADTIGRPRCGGSSPIARCSRTIPERAFSAWERISL